MKVSPSFSFLLVCLTVLVSSVCFASDNPKGLQRFLERYPEADLNGDGVLSREEARTFRMKLWQESAASEEDHHARQAPKERRAVTLGNPSYKGLSYGTQESQRFDLWLPHGHPLPCPTVFYLTAHQDDELPAQLFRDCLQQGWAVCRLYLRMEEETRSEDSCKEALEDLCTAHSFFSEQAVAHGIRPDSLFVYASDELAPLGLYAHLSASAEEDTPITLRAVALYLSREESIPESLKSVMLSVSKKSDKLGTCTLFHRDDVDPSWLFSSEENQSACCTFHSISKEEEEVHVFKKIVLFYENALK